MKDHSMSKKKNAPKLPKRFLGVKLPKATRKSVNALLKGLPSDTAKPLLGAAVGALIAALAAKLEQPLADLVEAQTATKKSRSKAEPVVPAVH
jgi:hypothetical protein